MCLLVITGRGSEKESGFVLPVKDSGEPKRKVF